MTLSKLITKKEADSLYLSLSEAGSIFSYPKYTLFQTRIDGVSITLYTSLKLVIQGKNIEECSFITSFLDSKVTTVKRNLVPYPHIGSDESGKGDFFGPLVVTACYTTLEQKKQLEALGVKDSKKLNDCEIHELSQMISSLCKTATTILLPEQYNHLYKSQFRNLNTMLGFGHGNVLRDVIKQSECKTLVVDKFANEKVMQAELKDISDLILHQFTSGESDLAVAAASIVARSQFVKSLESLERKYDIRLPKGASKNVKTAAGSILRKGGIELLQQVSKTHFKTFNEVTGIL